MDLPLQQRIAAGEIHTIELDLPIHEVVCTIDYVSGDDILLHVSLRPGEELAVINDRIAEKWGEEVRIPVLKRTLSETQAFRIHFGKCIQVDFGGIRAEFPRNNTITNACRILCSHSFSLRRLQASEDDLKPARLPIRPKDTHVLVLPTSSQPQQCYVDYTCKGAVLLHVSFRPKDGVIVVNDQSGSHWRKEIRMPISDELRFIEIAFEREVAQITAGKESILISRGYDFTTIDEVSGDDAIKVRTRQSEDAENQGGLDSRPAIEVVGRQPEFVSKILAHLDSVSLIEVKRSVRPVPDRCNPILISVIKNEFSRLHDFFRHYRTGGIERFVIIDNGSTDGSLEYAIAQPDADVYQSAEPFDWMLKQRWINKAISIFGLHRWYVYVDADEHAVFDGFGTKTFRDLAIFNEGKGVKRVRGFLVDMYADGPLVNANYPVHGHLADSFPYFDSSGYLEEKCKELVSVKGGPRKRVFGAEEVAFDPEMTKYPLFCPEKGEGMVNPHYLWPLDGNFSSGRMIAILHYKFLPGILEKIKSAVLEKNYWDDSFEYKCYLQLLERNPSISLFGEISRMYRGPKDLIECGLLDSCDWGGGVTDADKIRSALLRRKAELLGEEAHQEL